MSGSSNVGSFNHNAADGTKPKPPPAVSIRFTGEERARLNRDAGKQALSTYVRQKLLGDNVAARKPHYARKQRKPKTDARDIARLLAAFGQSELASSMLAIALAARTGSLPVTPELCEELDRACDDIREMRVDLVKALGIKSEGGA